MRKTWRHQMLCSFLILGVAVASASPSPSRLLYSNTFDARRIGAPSAAEFSHTGKFLAIVPTEGNTKGKVLIWNVQMGKVVRSFVAPFAQLLTFSPDDKSLAVVSLRADPRTSRFYHPPALYSVQLWDVQTGALRRTFVKPGSTSVAFYSVAISGDNKMIAAGSGDGRVQVWDMQTGKQITTFYHGGYPYGLAFSPDGRYLASIGGENEVAHLLSLHKGIPHRIFQVSELTASLIFTRDSKNLIVNGPNRGLNTYPLALPNPHGQTPSTVSSWVQDSPAISLSARGSLVSCVYNGRIVVWGAQAKRTLKTYKVGPETRQVLALHFMGDRLYWATSDYDDDNIYRIRLWHTT